MDCCLPNMFVGTLTRETFLTALEKGIGAEAAINFLRQHAHPKVANKMPSVPEVSLVHTCLSYLSVYLPICLSVYLLCFLSRCWEVEHGLAHFVVFALDEC